MAPNNHQNFDPEQIAYEDNHIIIINKKVGQLVQGDKTGDLSLLDHIKSYIKTRNQKSGNVFLGLVHRIDRPTSGLVIYAKTSKALSRLTVMVKDREIKKVYWALVEKADLAPSATLVHYLQKNEKTNKSVVFPRPTSGAKEARLHYTKLMDLDNYSLLEIELFTGRHHQIRAQLSKTGVPIKGDLKYGASRSNPDGGISLHARALEFTHPVNKTTISVTGALPNEVLWNVVKAQKKLSQ